MKDMKKYFLIESFFSFSKCTQDKKHHSKETKHQAQEIYEIQEN